MLKDRGFLERERTLAELKIPTGTRFLVQDEGAQQAEREQLARLAIQVAGRGWLGAQDAQEIGDRVGRLGWSAGQLREFLVRRDVPDPWPDRLVVGEPHYERGPAEYRDALKVAPRTSQVPAATDLLRRLAALRETHRLDLPAHHALCTDMKIPREVAEKLLVVPPPREPGLAAYEAELARLVASPPSRRDDLKSLVALRKAHEITPDEHHQMCVKKGVTPDRVQPLYEGAVPGLGPGHEEYRDALLALKRSPPRTPADLGQLLKIKKTHGIDAPTSTRLAAGIDLPADRAALYFTGQLPDAKQAARAAGEQEYGKELERLKKAPPRDVKDLETLRSLQAKHSVGFEKHQALCRKVGIAGAHVQPLFDGIPPHKLERAQAQLEYREALRAVNLDGVITDPEKAHLAEIRGRLKITVEEHREACEESQVPPDQSDWLLTPPRSTYDWIGWMVLALLVLTSLGIVGAMAMDGLPFYKPPPRPSRPSTRAAAPRPDRDIADRVRSGPARVRGEAAC